MCRWRVPSHRGDRDLDTFNLGGIVLVFRSVAVGEEREAIFVAFCYMDANLIA